MPPEAQKHQTAEQAARIRSGIGQNPVEAIQQLKSWATREGSRADVRKDSVMLFLEVTDLIELNKTGTPPDWSPEMKAVQARAYDLLEQLVIDLESNEGAQQQLKREQAHQKLKDSLPVEMTVFKGEGLTKSYNSSKSDFQLGPIDLQLKFGEITGVVGENGNGKSTLLKIIAGIHKESGGTISYPAFSGKELNWKKIKPRIAYIPQRLDKWSGSVRDNLLFAAVIKGFRKQEAIQEFNYILKRLNLEKFKDATWENLSGGYQMRFELARALIWKPSLLILDEPLANLDINAQLTFLRDLRFLTNSFRNPLAVVMSSQHLHKVEQVSDRVIFLRAGKPLFNGPISEIGKDRTENIFEIAGNFNAQLLRSLLNDLDVFEVRDEGQTILVKTSPDIAPVIIMEKLIDRGLSISFFRDITYSTRKYFEVST